MALILTQFMYLLLQNIKMIFGTKISKTYMDSFCDALIAWKKLLLILSLNWIFCALHVRSTSDANKLCRALCLNSLSYITLDIIQL